MATQPQITGYLRNMRAYLPERLSARAGMAVVNATPFDQLNIHSIRRLNDPVLGTSKRVYGAGTKLYLSEGTAAADTGYSGNPLSLVPFQPAQSPESWMYVADSAKMRKIRSDGLLHSVGMEPPLVAPSTAFGPPAVQILSSFATVGSWVNGGTAGAISVVNRLTGTITEILYDSGSVGFASVIPSAGTAQMQPGMLVLVNSGGGSQETVVVTGVYQAVGSTTIASIVYDSGTAGLCTIAPVAATVAGGTGTLPPPVGGGTGGGGGGGGRQGGGRLSFATRLATPPLPVPPKNIAPTTHPLGLQQDAIVLLNSGGGNQEYVRVISISVGPNGQASFRCSTVNTHVATETITGESTFRAFFSNTHVNTEPLSDKDFQTTVTAGIGFLTITSPFNLSEADGNPLQETDTINISLNFDHPEFLIEAKLLFDVDPTTNDFAHNYFYYTMRQSDVQQAAMSNQSQLAARQQAITRSVTELYQRPQRQLRAGPVLIGDGSNDIGIPQASTSNPRFGQGGSVGTSSQANTGAFQWTTFSFKVSDLIRVGANTAQSLANVAAIRIQFQVSSSTVCEAGDLWVGGTYGPDIGTIGAPYFYRYRGHSKVTGVISLAGPPTRNTVSPHNQQIVVTGPQHPNPSCDTIDVFRWGGTLPQWTFVGSTPNQTNWEFLDIYSDTDIEVNPLLQTDVFQPFPTIDLPRSGVCNVAGTKITWVSGDTFNPLWYPGTKININGIYYSLYAQPPGNNTLEIIENASTQANVPFFLNQATLLDQPLPAFWGPYAEGTAAFGFACGDTHQPGVLFLTNGNDFDSASDTLQLYVCAPSEPLMNGCMYGSTPYVWSSDRLFVLNPNLGQTVTAPTPLTVSTTQLFVPYPVPGGKGLFAQWCFCVGDLLYYRSKSGIEGSNGSSSQSITDQDLYLLFGHDGQPGQPVTVGSITFFPPDDTKLNNQRLSHVDGHVYFDYIDTNGTQRTMVYNTISNTWGVDDYTPTVLIHYADEGKGIHAMVLGGSNGIAYTAAGIVDGAGSPFPCEARMPQLSELQGGYTVPYDGFLGLQGSQSGDISLVVNVDGTDNPVSVPVTTQYFKNYVRLNASKGKILAFGMVSTFPFTAFLRDIEFRVGKWGRQDQATPVNPFGNMRRAAAPKVG